MFQASTTGVPTSLVDSTRRDLRAANAAPVDAAAQVAMTVHPDNDLHCDYCNARISGAVNVHQHLNGRKHLANVIRQQGFPS
jgi:hypothetical protein